MIIIHLETNTNWADIVLQNKTIWSGYLDDPGPIFALGKALGQEVDLQEYQDD